VANTSSSRMYKKIGIMEDPAIQSIINNVFLRGCKGKLGRNNAVFILSLAMKYEGKTESEIIDKIDEWNSQIKSPLKHTEILRTVKSAMNDKYNAPKKDYVEEL
ncbi:primase C-terminal domain-containing protein, partial [Bacillus sp. ZZQ-131]